MTMGEPGKNGVRTSDLKECQEILDVFFSHGHKELDTARTYAEGTTEKASVTDRIIRRRVCTQPSQKL